ncbi:hypothetical protein LWI29_020992 [Acer saccharum]|uniref:RRM domain-containing protein n=1 Tax=Acer saccharum TaxID=4024 RepID=A0AA39RSL6_ACESA|nr:hypothetical protein LWI29_020992 [Acer saccharum]
MESEGGGNFKTKKIFVGGLPPTLTEDGFRQYFESYGHVTDVVVTQRPRGFGFITFDSEDAVDRVLHKTFHELMGKRVEVKPALPKYANSSGGSRQGYGSSSDQQQQTGGRKTNLKLRTLRGGHRSGVGSMAWNNHILTTGGHTHEVCGLKWSPSSQQLASGGGDHLLQIWDRRSTQWLHRLEEHTLLSRLLFGVLTGAICWQPEMEALLGV